MQMAHAGFSSYDELFAEKEKRWNAPSETMEDYLARLNERKQQNDAAKNLAVPPIQECEGTMSSGQNSHEGRTEDVKTTTREHLPLDDSARDPPRAQPSETTANDAQILLSRNIRNTKRKISLSSVPAINKRRRSVEPSASTERAISRWEGTTKASYPDTELREKVGLAAGHSVPVICSSKVRADASIREPTSRPLPTSVPTLIIGQPTQQIPDASTSHSISALSNASTHIDIEMSNITSPGNSPALRSQKLPSAAPSLPDLLLAPKKALKRSIPLHKVSTLPMPSKPIASRKSKQKKEKEKLMTPLEYAQKLQAHISASTSEVVSSASHSIQLLLGQNVWYYGSDNLYASESTRKRMKLIMDYGATLLPKFDLRLVTHIVTENRATKGPMLRAANVKSFDEIPTHIPIIKWDWVETSARVGRMLPCMEFPVFANRVPIVEGSVEWIASKAEWAAKMRESGEEVDRSADFSRISDYSDSAPTSTPRAPSQNHKGKGKTVSHSILPLLTTVDPLAEFYEQAKEEANNNLILSDLEDGYTSTSNQQAANLQKQTPMFQCDRKDQDVSSLGCPNQDIIDKLNELKELHDAKPSDDDHWRSYSYTKTIRALRVHPRRIESTEDALAIPGIGHKTAQKIMEIIETGHLRRIDSENTEETQIVKLFAGVYGAGIRTARQWHFAGCRTLQDLLDRKGGIVLAEAQEIGINYYEDINSRMPREEAASIFTKIKTIARKIDPKLFIEIMGSYRRGKKDCGDIDILISRDPSDGKTHAGALRKLLELSREAGIITEDLAMPGPHELDDFEAVYRGLCVLPGKPDARRRRIDFLSVAWRSRGAALIYYTGDDIFNRSMRLKARKEGYSLNQKGLWAGVIRDPKNGNKLNNGTIIASETEREIFDILGVPWQEPHERVRS